VVRIKRERMMYRIVLSIFPSTMIAVHLLLQIWEQTFEER
jgi:hypothetical protein